MFFRAEKDLNSQRVELQSAKAELAELERQIHGFERQVDAQLGSLLDQLTDLNSETYALDEQLRHIREQRLFGPELMDYLAGAPVPTRPINLADLPPEGLAPKNVNRPPAGAQPSSQQSRLPEIKTVYRRLARLYHPDLARSDADRTQANEQMKEINRAYQAGDLKTLMKLVGMSIPLWMDVPAAKPPVDEFSRGPLTERDKIERELRDVRMSIRRLSNLPIVKLSLDVKLARHKGRNLLNEMAAELQYKIARKIAERDYLRSQINTNID
jgi:hypothetical protein